jgi:hypothetical protein
MVSSILWDRSASRAAFTLPLSSMPGQRANPRAQLFEKRVNQPRVTHGDGNRLQHYEWPCNIRGTAVRLKRSTLDKSPHGFWPYSVMQVEYVYQGQVLELYSLALLYPNTEHV